MVPHRRSSSSDPDPLRHDDHPLSSSSVDSWDLQRENGTSGISMKMNGGGRPELDEDSNVDPPRPERPTSETGDITTNGNESQILRRQGTNSVPQNMNGSGESTSDITTANGAVDNGYGELRAGHFPPQQALGLLFEHTNDGSGDRTSLVDVLQGAEAGAALNGWSEKMSPSKGDMDREREKVLKLSPAQIQELTSSPQSIPYRPVASETEQGRRVVSDSIHTTGADSDAGESRIQLEGLGLGTPVALKQSVSNGRTRPPASRTVSTPSSSRRPTLPVTNERLAQTWASRSKQDRPGVSQGNGRLEQESKQPSPSPLITESALPSPIPPSIPLPPLSVPTYLQLELASGRPSPLYIHRSVTNDFPYESSRVKLERLSSFLRLPPALEQVLWFGILACLDAWLYSFTILPLRFCKAVYILLESWLVNLGMEFRFVSDFVIKGIGRVWRRQKRSARVLDAETKSRAASTERESRAKSGESRRRHRADTHKQHRRQKSIPSALLPDDKADILKGLLMIATCCVLMYFDASRMYHWIRGQAAIKLYVIYNVLEVSDRLLAAIGQDVLECLFSREALERRPDGRSKVFRPFGLFLLAMAYTVIHATALFYQVMTLNVAVNSYSNALITLLLSNQFVEIKSTVFKKFEKENLFQLTCADVVERFQLWLMLTIIASRNIVETGAFNFVGTLSSSLSSRLTSTNSTPLSTPPRSSSSILPQAFTFFPSSLISSFSQVNSFLPTLAQVLGPFLVVLGSEMLVDWLKHAYIGKFNNTRPAMYGRFLDVLAKDYYTNAFGDQNLTKRLGLPVIPLSCLFFRVSVQTYQMFLAALLPHQPSLTAVESTSLASIHSHYVPSPIPSAPQLTLRTILPASAAHASAFFRRLLANAMPSPAQSVYIFTIVLILTAFILLLILKLLLGMLLLAYARSRYKAMKAREVDVHKTEGSTSTASRREFVIEGSRRVGGWGSVEVNDDKRRWIYLDDPEGLRRLKAREERDKEKAPKEGEASMDHVQRYEMVAKRIW
ncbi:hypothetical protein CNMCM5793_004585 [Aspergillus hiratsukae]|uniref:Cytomegalovirus gH-receptor family protein n=1 Tax=Aspergillus hiratsukae TaxID=1194566 RepID=A0A8H6QBD1_9EURO|nr:hypothetical protein CNMCM5793_004585 [Aspergillus hiratsukae]KAF7169976.1 hypothetical protein CNMCM6106_004815 [Aspergillus hiratsukae]